MVNKTFLLACLFSLLFTTPALAASAMNQGSAGTVAFLDATQGVGDEAATGMAFKLNGTEMMRVTAGGSVGIGTTSPFSTFEVRGPSTSSVLLGNSAIRLAIFSSNSDTGMSLEAANYDNTLKRNLYLAAWGGRVGIGTTSPYNSLDVRGGIGFLGGLFINSYYSSSGWKATTDGYGAYLQYDKGNGTLYYWPGKASVSADSGFTTGDAALVIIPNGNVGIGTTSPSYLLHVNGTAYASGAAGALSDERHKKDVRTLAVSGLGTVAKLRPVSFLWKEPKDDGMKGEQLGFIAQEVEKVLPQVVLTENNAEKTKGIKYTEIIPIMAKAIQELKGENDNLKSQNAAFAARLEKLEARVK